MEQYEAQVTEALLTACRVALARIEKDFAGQRIFGFVLAPDSGFVSFAVAIGLRGDDETPESNKLSPEMIAKLPPDLLASLAKMRTELDPNEAVASEWENYGTYSDCFDDVYELIAPLFETFYESNTPEEISDFFEDISTNVLLQLKQEKAFRVDVFEDDVLLGIQFADPDRADRVIRVSSKLNSDAWHGRIVEFFGQHVDKRPRKRKR